MARGSPGLRGVLDVFHVSGLASCTGYGKIRTSELLPNDGRVVWVTGGGKDVEVREKVVEEVVEGE